MIKGILFRLSPAAKLGATVLITLVSFFIIYFIGIIVLISVFHWNILQNPELLINYTKPENIKVLKFLQLVQSIGLFVMPPIIIGYLCYPSVLDFLRLRKKPCLVTLALTLLAGIFFLPFSNWLAYLNSFLELPWFMSGIEQWMHASEEYAAQITQAFLNVNSITGLLYNILLIAILPAIGEELLFRGLLQRIFTEWSKNIHWGILISAFLFSVIHFQFFGFLPRFFLGVFFGYLLEVTGSLWVPISAHFINNLTGVLLSYFIANQAIPEKSSDFGMTSETWIYGVLGGILGIFMLWLIFRKEDRVL
ncbi:MAG: CPBP family intramembrane metalloprotease domain-containing protein [Bacteroidetes bacterium CG23_combo_of_CG06-09_8_20_14_all_32_9]|nr:MAG: CPBP family intramembrane metalloprotease domain-containing protein [Bacteroidetes bacterium CG23_combo_of_CG06-09_8_20_14_all_32_9]